MPTLRFPNTPDLALLANAIANLGDGEFRQFGPAGHIDVHLAGRLRIDRAALFPVHGRVPDDAMWRVLSAPPIDGRQVEVDDNHVVVDD